MLANVGFSASIVALNAYLPGLAKESPEVASVLESIQETSDTDHFSNSATPQAAQEPLLPGYSGETVTLRKRYDTVLAAAISRISSLGIALGYGAGIILLLLTLIPVTKLHGSTFSLRLAIGLSGMWWSLFSIPAAIWLPGADEPGVVAESAIWVDESEVTDENKKWDLRREIVASWKGLGNMLRWREIKKMRNTFRYLAAWFLLSDGQLASSLTKVRELTQSPISQASRP
jgi:UMF1 family MFS transporter